MKRARLFAVQLASMLVLFACGQTAAAPTQTPRSSPSPSPTMSAADRGELAMLEARPLKLPTLLPGGQCRPDQQDPSTGLWGTDPVYVMGGPHSSSPYGDYFDVSAMTKPGLGGPVLIRGRDLKAANHPVVFVGPWGVGPVFGNDPTHGTQYTELALDTAHPTLNSYPINGVDYVQWFWTQGIAFGWTGCVGFQIDGQTFSEDINVNTPTK